MFCSFCSSASTETPQDPCNYCQYFSLCWREMLPGLDGNRKKVHLWCSFGRMTVIQSCSDNKHDTCLNVWCNEMKFDTMRGKRSGPHSLSVMVLINSCTTKTLLMHTGAYDNTTTAPSFKRDASVAWLCLWLKSFLMEVVPWQTVDCKCYLHAQG